MIKTFGNNPFFLKIFGVILLVAVWHGIGVLYASQTMLYLATPRETLAALYILFRFHDLLFDIFATFLRTISAFVPAVFFGVLAGLILGFSKRLYYLCEAPIEFFRSLPATALLPIFILTFGINDVARIGIALFIGFWVVLINTTYGVTHSSELRRNVAISMHATRRQIFMYVTLWEILPYIFSAMRLTISISLVIVLIAEMVIGPERGLGIKLLNAQQTFRVDNVYAIILMTGTLGLILNKFIWINEKRVIHWKTV